MEDEIEVNDNLRDTFSTAKRAVGFAYKNEKRLVVLTFTFAIILAAVVYLQATSFSSIVNEIVRIKENNLGITRDLINQAILLGATFLVPAILQNLQSRFVNELSTRLGTHIEMLQIDAYSALDIGTVEGTEFQTKLQRASKWGTGSIWNAAYYVRMIAADIAGFVASGLVLFFINPYLVILAIVGALPYYFVENIYCLKLFLLYHTHTDESRIGGNRMQFFKDPKKLVEILLFNIKGLFRKQIKDNYEIYDNSVIKVGRQQSLATFGADFLQMACLFAAIIFVTVQTINGNLLIGSLFLAFTAYRGFVSTSQGFFQDFSKLEEQSRYAKRWFDIFDIKSKVVSKPNAVKPAWLVPPRIELDNVSFAYPESDKTILKNISMTIESGEKLAIVGQNGAGKTTLIKLLCRVYEPTEGAILIDGINLKDIDLDYWREYLGVLFQDFSNYNMTIRESIAIAKPDEPIDDEKVVLAAEMTDADEFIKEFPNKYNQLVWKGFKDGVELSKGQFQRMAVARIFYRDAAVSILDEPTSAIDAVAEEKIFDVLEKKMAGKTVVLISHRFSTVKNADKIAVIEHGELKEVGTHKSLMAKKGRYEELFSMQANKYLETEA
ncbi:MAG: ABC transporter ATP-binding protein [Patescibacteria group bacterium]